MCDQGIFELDLMLSLTKNCINMRNIALLFLMISFLIFASCKRKIQTDTIVIDIDVLKESDKTFEELFKKKKTIELETTEESFFNHESVIRVMFTHDKIIIKQNFVPYLMIFDISGKFLFKMDKSGRGPGEYGSRIDDIYLHNDTIIVRSQTDFYLYDDNGLFIRKLDIKESVHSFIITPDDNVMIDRDLRGIDESNWDNYYAVKLYSKNGIELKSLLKRDLRTNATLFIGTSPSLYIDNGDDIYLSPVSENAIYIYDKRDTSFRKIYELNFDEAPMMDFTNKSVNEITQFINIEMINPYIKYVGQKYLVVDFYADTGKKRLIFSRDGDETYIMKRDKYILSPNNMGYLLSVELFDEDKNPELVIYEER